MLCRLVYYIGTMVHTEQVSTVEHIALNSSWSVILIKYLPT